MGANELLFLVHYLPARPSLENMVVKLQLSFYNFYVETVRSSKLSQKIDNKIKMNPDSSFYDYIKD